MIMAGAATNQIFIDVPSLVRAVIGRDVREPGSMSPCHSGASRSDEPGMTWREMCAPRTAAAALLRPQFLRQHQHLARAGDVGPVAVEVGDEPFHLIATGTAFERGLIGELIHRLVQR